MANKKPNYFTVECELHYAKVFERNRDMGNDSVDHSEYDGLYSVDMIVDESAKKEMMNAGVPETAMNYQMFKPTEDGRYKYKIKRKHLNTRLTDDDGNPVVMGPPEVVDLNQPFFDEDTGKRGYEPWDTEVNIGNGSVGRIKGQVYFGRQPIVTLIKVGVLNLVEYEGGGDGF